MRRPLLLVAWLLASCAPKSVVELPIPEGIQSLLYFFPRAGATGSDLYAIEGPLALLTASGTTGGALLLGYRRDLADLDLEAGRIDQARQPLTRPPPTADLALALAPDGSYSERPRLAPPSFLLPTHDWTQILNRGHCADGPEYLSAVCGSTVSVEVMPPALPRIAASCPSGWSSVSEAIDRGPPLGTVSLDRCEPPPRQRCGRATLQSAGDPGCRPVGQACAPGDDFPLELPSGRALIFVRAGAAAGDGSRARPYATIAEAVNAAGADAVIAVGKGRYDEAPTLSGQVDLLGACAAETELRGPLRLVGHRGSVENLSLGPVLAEDALSTLAGVAIVSTSTALEARRGSAVRIRDSRLEADTTVAQLVGARLELIDSATLGPITARTSTLVLSRSALTATTSEGATADLLDSDLFVGEARLGLQIELRRSGAYVPRAQIVGSWFGLGPSHPRRSCFGGGSTDCWVALRARGARIEIERTTFDLRTLLVEVIPGQVSEQIAVQIGDDANDHREPAVLRDLFLVLPTIDFKPEPTLHLVGLALNRRSSIGPDEIERVAVLGGAFGALTSREGWLRIRDYATYANAGSGLLGVSAKVDAERVEMARNGTGVAGGCDHHLKLSDLGVYNTGGIGLHLGGQEADTTLLRVVLSGGQPTQPALRITTEDSSDDCQRELGAMVTARQLRIDQGFRFGLDLTAATSIDLTDFAIDVGEVAVRFATKEGRRCLRRGVLRGAIGFFVAPGEDLAPFVEHVRVEATIPVMY